MDSTQVHNLRVQKMCLKLGSCCEIDNLDVCSVFILSTITVSAWCPENYNEILSLQSICFVSIVICYLVTQYSGAFPSLWYVTVTPCLPCRDGCYFWGLRPHDIVTPPVSRWSHSMSSWRVTACVLTSHGNTPPLQSARWKLLSSWQAYSTQYDKWMAVKLRIKKEFWFWSRFV